MNRITTIFIICFCVVLVLKFAPIPDWKASLEKHSESDLGFYVTMAHSFLGDAVSETPRIYQYPPVYTLMIIPGILSGNLILYVLLMDAVFASLIFIALFFYAKKFMKESLAIFTALFISVSSIFLLPLKSFGYPFMFVTLLFILFLYFFKEKKFISSMIFMLLVATSYVSLFLTPFILLSFFMNKKNIYDFMRSSILFLMPAGMVVLIWSLRNTFLNGMTVTGAIGGYSELSGAVLVNVPDRLYSFFIYYEPLMIMIYSLIFLFGSYLIYKRKQRELYPFYFAMMFNLLFFACTLGFIWDLSYFSWRYLCFMMPCYLLLGVYPIVTKKEVSI